MSARSTGRHVSLSPRNLHLYLQSVISKEDAVGKPSLRLLMQSDLMGEMGKKSTSGTYPPAELDGFRYQLVRMMRPIPAKCVHHEGLDPFEIRKLGIVHRLHVRYVGELPETIAEDGQPAVHHVDRYHLYVADPYMGMRRKGMQVQFGNTGIEVFGKTIGEIMPQTATGDCIRIDIYVA